MSEIKISEVKPDTYFDSEVTLDKMFLLTVPPCPFTQSKISLVTKWGFTTVFAKTSAAHAAHITQENGIRKPVAKVPVSKIETETIDISEFGLEDDDRKPANDNIPDKFKTSESVDISAFDSDAPGPAVPEPKSEPQKKVSDNFKNTTTQAKTSLTAYLENHNSSSADRSIRSSMGARDPYSISEEEDTKIMESAQKTYEKFMDYITQVYTKYSTHKTISQNELNGKVLELCNFVRETKKFILRISPSYEARNKNFLISHSMRTTVLSIVIGMQLNMPYEKLIELGVASILHEIGQIRLPPQFYMNEKPLTPAEKAQMATHTVIGYNIVKEAGFPLTIQLGVLDHHERETGSGYPRHLTGNAISPYAKIIAVACSYEAITAPRHFKEARTTYEGMIEMLKNSNHLYDDAVVKALLYSVSLFPIGAYVYLANGKVGQVVDVSPASPKNPMVKIIGGINTDGSAKIVQTDEANLKIVRVMTKQETKDLKQALGTEI